MQDLSNTLSRQGRHQEALWYAEQGLIGDGTAVELANGLNAIGLIHAYAGNYEEALPYCQRAERAAGTVDEPFLNRAIADSLAYVHHHLGQYPLAIDCYQRAVRLVREVDDNHTAARTLVRLGETQRAAGQPDAAARSWREALDILDPIDPIEAASVREKLDDLATPVK
jgi:tetratricopeptide (TPR) repeat protein